MSKHLRLSEKWFNRGLWIISFIFAWFLIGLGSAVVDDLPRVERSLQQEYFIDQVAMLPLKQALAQENILEDNAQKALKEIQTKLTTENKIYQNADETFRNWISTRQATKRADQDEELITRTKELDRLKEGVNRLDHALSQRYKILETIGERKSKIQAQINVLNQEAYEKLSIERKKQNLRVFLYRLAITLPLLFIATWLFVKKRKSQYWPFAWGFIFFALFTFFVELVPYLPSYGGYVRYGVGIMITLLGGHYAIRGLNNYLTRQKLAEAQPETIRRKELSYDVALVRLAKGICPGCERVTDLKDPERDFCPHCGINLFNHCGGCQTRKSTFVHFCHKCGTSAVGRSEIG